MTQIRRTDTVQARRRTPTGWAFCSTKVMKIRAMAVRTAALISLARRAACSLARSIWLAASAALVPPVSATGSSTTDSTTGASDLAASDLAASDLGASDLGASDLGASDLAASDLGASDLE